MKLANKKAIVTGGTRGIGNAIVRELAGNGCSVVFTYFSSDDTARLLENELTSDNVKVLGFKADAASFAAAQETVNYAIQNIGGLDILEANSLAFDFVSPIIPALDAT